MATRRFDDKFTVLTFKGQLFTWDLMTGLLYKDAYIKTDYNFENYQHFGKQIGSKEQNESDREVYEGSRLLSEYS
jgi:hypothetical protein